MAVSEIHTARSTVNRLIAYIMKDKTEIVESEKEINSQYQHKVEQNGKKMQVTYFTHSSCMSCDSRNPYQTFQMLEKKYRKDSSSGKSRSKDQQEPLAYHARISFAGHECSQETALEFGERIAESVFHGFPTVISVHTNTDNIHIHFAVCAWNLQGKKWNNCHRTTQQLREGTDTLCREYGLSVLEHTRTMKLTKVRQGNRTSYYENTDIRFERGTPAYQFTEKYQKLKEQRVRQTDIVREDMENILPRCSSYEDLLDRMRQLGYTIRAKRQDGSWMQHISFKAPTYDKAIREDKIGENGEYCREVLEQRIQKQLDVKVPEKISPEKSGEDLPIYRDYRYSKIKVQEINEDYYMRRFPDGTYAKKPRSEWMKKVIRSLKNDDYHVRTLLDTTELWALVEEQENRQSRGQKFRYDTEAARYVAQIENTFRAMRYVEMDDFRSYGQLLDICKSIHRTHSEILQQREKVAKMIADRESDVRLPDRIAELKERIKNRNIDYMVEHYHDDVSKLEKLQAKYNSLGFSEPERIAEYQAKTDQFRSRLAVIDAELKAAEARFAEADNCIRTFARIDAEHGIDVSGAMQQYENILHGNYGEQNVEEDRSKNRDEQDRNR